MAASPSMLRQRSGSTPHDALTVDRPSSSHQPLSQPLDRQCPRSCQMPPILCAPTHRKCRFPKLTPAPQSPYSPAKQVPKPHPFQIHQVSRRDQIPIAFAAPHQHPPPRFRALALFGRRSHQHVDSSSHAGDQKPAQERTGAPRAGSVEPSDKTSQTSHGEACYRSRRSRTRRSRWRDWWLHRRYR